MKLTDGAPIGTKMFTRSALPPEKPAKTTTGGKPSAPIAATFHTDDGRPVTVGGGITPDTTIEGHADDPWLTFISQRGYLTSFAESYLTTHGRLAEPFEISPDMLEDFKTTLEHNGARVPYEYWSKDQGYLALKLKVEITNLVYGLERGNEIETQGDPQVQQAAALFPRAAEILKRH